MGGKLSNALFCLVCSVIGGAVDCSIDALLSCCSSFCACSAARWLFVIRPFAGRRSLVGGMQQQGIASKKETVVQDLSVLRLMMIVAVGTDYHADLPRPP
eukprot:1158328-Pelagomonas_calceolata.AAC.2